MGLLRTTYACLPVLAVCAAACGDAAGPPVADVAGVWTGTFSSNLLPTLTLDIGITQEGSVLTGTYLVVDSGLRGSLAGTVDGDEITFTLTHASILCPGFFTGTGTTTGGTLSFSLTGSDCAGQHANAQGSLTRTSTGAPSASAGVWGGDTSQDLPVFFRIRMDGRIDSLTVRLSLNLGGASCTATFRAAPPITVSGSAFTTIVAIPGVTDISTVLRGTIGNASADGSWDSYSGSYSIVCGSSLVLGTGSVLGAGSWSAQKF